MPKQAPLELPTMLRVRDVAAYLNISMKLAYRLVKTPGCPLVILTAKAYRIPRDAFLRWLEEQPGTQALTQARDRLHAPVVPAVRTVWEKAGNGTTPRAIARTPGRD
jgi:excisionase family DNA binding protein